ncbi:putative integral membrane protein [Acanthocheilonema viteae]|uniref:Uncharacterized protein n=1 Tax=Acanthocheilonema viteae TaxID=6277 RepID=A0A498SL35_ACAVI|nr:unnamed protein product [Acanthocheilonema viteae]
MEGLKKEFTNVISQVDAHDDILQNFRIACETPNMSTISEKTLISRRPPILQAQRKNQPLVEITKYVRSSGSPNDDVEGDNHPAKQLANYKLYNSYTFFGTIHIKTSATMLTVFYILSLAVADFIVISEIDSSSATHATAASATILFAILLAQYGMWKESSLCLLPLMIIQILLGIMMVLAFAFSNLIEFHCFLIDACPSGRFFIFAMGSAIFCVTHYYCVIIIWLCWKYFHYLGKKTELEQIWRVERIDDEIDENVLINNIPLNAN